MPRLLKIIVLSVVAFLVIARLIRIAQPDPGVQRIQGIADEMRQGLEDYDRCQAGDRDACSVDP